MPIVDLQERLREFACARDWDQFHDPKNLVMALSSEVGELIEIFQWLTADQARPTNLTGAQRVNVRHELADVFGYLIRLADVLDVNLEGRPRGEDRDQR